MVLGRAWYRRGRDLGGEAAGDGARSIYQPNATISSEDAANGGAPY